MQTKGKVMKKLIYLIAAFSSPVFATQAIECNFTGYSDGIGHYKEEDTLKLTFLINNSDKKTYMTRGDASSKTEVEYIESYLGKTFINIIGASGYGRDGSITTINKKMEAVHSHHYMSAYGLGPKQYYGSCANK